MKRLKRTRNIRGAGGDSGSPPTTPQVAADSLSSTALLNLIDLISEGEIEGLVNGYKSIYLDQTQVLSNEGVWNFGEGAVYYDSRPGTQDQTYMQGFSDIENEITVNVETRSDVPTVRQITDPNVNRVRVRVMVPQLSSQDLSSGTVSGTDVTVVVSVQPNGGVYTDAVTKTISGKSSNKYEVVLEALLTGSAPWNVKLTRLTPDSTSDSLQNKTYFESYTEIIDTKLTYPNSALIGLTINSKMFQNVPARAYDVKLLKIKIPSNYDPITRVYTGTWDGTFQVAWSDNPAWVFYDIATNDRYGLGSFIPEEQVDKWSLYQIAQYCDEIVSDGFGGAEPRFTCNLMLTSSAEAYTILQSLASVFRGMVYWAGGTVVASQDAPQDASYLFTAANVVDGKFTYQGASAKVRHTVALVSWNDPSNFYKQSVEYIEDQSAIAKYGVQQTNLTAFGCTSRGQAHRLGKWLLYTEQNESEIVVFKTGLDGVIGRPGQVIKIADPARAGARMGGRIKSATTSDITIDADLNMSVAGSTLSVLMPDGTLQERTAVGQTGRVIHVQPAFDSAPNAQSVWVLSSDIVDAQAFRVIGITEESGGVYTVTALRHDPGKFDFVERNIQLAPKNYSILSAPLDPPSNLKFTESLYSVGTDVRVKVTVSWDKVDFASAYAVSYRLNSDNYTNAPQTSFNEYEILNASPGTYTVQVSSINALGKVSAFTEASSEIFGKTKAPSDISNFSMFPIAGQAFLSWDKAGDLDVLIGGQVRIRHTPLTSGQSWANAVDIIPAVSGTATSATAPLLSGTYMAKFVDSSGNLSQDENMVVTTVPSAIALNIVQTQTENPSFAGTRTNMVMDTVHNALTLASALKVDAYPLIDSIFDWDLPGSIIADGTYNFQNTIDLGGVWPVNISSHILVEAFDTGNPIDLRAAIDTWQDLDGAFVDDVNAELFVRTTEDDPAGTPTWTVWKSMRAGSYQCRGLQFMLECTSGSNSHNIRVKELSVSLDMLDRSLNLGSYTSGTGASYHVSFAEPFFATPVIAITGDGLSSGDFYSISGASASGFDITFKNSSGTIVSRVFSVLAKGYGRKVA